MVIEGLVGFARNWTREIAKYVAPRIAIDGESEYVIPDEFAMSWEMLFRVLEVDEED